MKKKIDYKGKWFILQDELDDEGFDIECGQMEDKDITDDFLRRHIEACIYYGIPEYIGKDEKLKERIEKLYQEPEIKKLYVEV